MIDRIHEEGRMFQCEARLVNNQENLKRMLDGKFKIERVERVKKMSISIVVRFAGFVVVEN